MTRVLVAVADDRWADVVQSGLRAEGFEVEVVKDGREALQRVRDLAPDLLLLDLEVPTLEGTEVLRRLRERTGTAAVPVLLLAPQSTPPDTLVDVTSDADDYLVTPFSTSELLARVATTLQRTAEVRSTSSLTALPGQRRLERELDRRAAGASSYAVCHLDVDGLTSVNERYGFLRGDDVLQVLADCLRAAAGAAGDPEPLVAHLGADDFVVVCAPEQAEPLCRRAVVEFDAQVVSRYDPVDAARGWVEVPGPDGAVQRRSIVTVSAGVALQGQGSADLGPTTATAAELLRYAKSSPGSVVAVDRRRVPR